MLDPFAIRYTATSQKDGRQSQVGLDLEGLHAASSKRGQAPLCTLPGLVDVPAALAGRRYASEVDMVLAVDDPVCPWNHGSWRLRGGPDGAECGPTTAAPDLTVGVAELGAAYLGGTTVAALGAAGLVTEHTRGTLAAAGTALTWPIAPHCSWEF